MPFVQPAQWEAHLFSPWEENVKSVNVPLYDKHVWTWSPELRPLLNRLTVALKCHYSCGPHGVLPDKYPIISKPVYNLYGSSIGVEILQDQQHYLDRYTPGHFWMPYFRGEQLSTDILVYHREVISMISAKAECDKKHFYKFRSWQLIEEPPQMIKQTIRSFVAQHVPLEYCGALNIETIGTNIIEVNGRFSPQFCQFYSPEWFQVMCCLYQHGTLLHKKIPPHITGSSFPIWWWVIPQDWQMPKHDLMYDTRTDCVNQILPRKRIGVINTETHEEGERIRTAIYKELGVDVIDKDQV